MSSVRFFFYGTLCHAPLLDVVLGRRAVVREARLADHAVYWADEQSFPLIVPEPGGVALGIVVDGITEAEAARLDFYEGGFDYAVREVTVEAAGERLSARVYLPGPGWRTGAPWSLSDWQRQWGEIVTETAHDFMALYGTRPAHDVLVRYPQMLDRAASRLRARKGGPAEVRRQAAPNDVRVFAHRQPYAGYFALEEYDMAYRRFDGSFSTEVNRVVFISGDAATVLPYDPARDRVLVIEQFRPGPYARGDAQPWLLEPIAGRIDAGETPEETVRREAVEEAGLAIGELHPIASYYPSPAAKAEYIYAFLGIADLPDAIAGRIGGVAGEHEDIRAHVMDFVCLEELVAAGEIQNGPLLLSALYLARHRDRLRAGA